jgi:hypothetical protein
LLLPYIIQLQSDSFQPSRTSGYGYSAEAGPQPRFDPFATASHNSDVNTNFQSSSDGALYDVHSSDLVGQSVKHSSADMSLSICASQSRLSTQLPGLVTVHPDADRQPYKSLVASFRISLFPNVSKAAFSFITDENII